MDRFLSCRKALFISKTALALWRAGWVWAVRGADVIFFPAGDERVVGIGNLELGYSM